MNNIEIIDCDYPIEIILHNKIKCIVAYFSTSLLRASSIFNIPAYVYSSSYLNIMTPNQNKLENKVQFFYPNINDFINNNPKKLILKSFFYKKYKKAKKINKVISILNPNNTQNEIDQVVHSKKKQSFIKLVLLKLFNR